MAEMAKAPSAILQKLIREKLAAEGVGDRSGLVEALAEHLLSGASDTFDWDEGSGGEVVITFTEADIQRLDALANEFLKSLPELISHLSSTAAASILKTLKREWSSQYEFERRSCEGFRQRLEARWSEGFHGLRMLLTMCRELGGEVAARHRRSRSRKGRALRAVLLHLHTRGCQVTAEIITLMENGFADGAMARWRTLYEIGVVATVLSEGGEELAERYLAHEVVESKLALEEYDRCHRALGFRPMPLRERRRIERTFHEVVNAYGSAFGKPNGWATQHLRLKKVTFKDLEDAAQRSGMRSYYKMASYNVHADAKGIFHRLGSLGDPSMALAGASNAGFVEPGQNTAVTLVQMTALLLHDRVSNLDVMIQLQLLISVRDDISRSLHKASRALQRDHARYQGKQKEKALTKVH